MGATNRTDSHTVALNKLTDQILRSAAPAGVRLAAVARAHHPDATQKELAAAFGMCVGNVKRGDCLIRAVLQEQKGRCAGTFEGSVQRPKVAVQIPSKVAAQRPIARASQYDLNLRSINLSLSSSASAPPAPPGDRFAAPLASRASPQDAGKPDRRAFGAGPSSDQLGGHEPEPGETDCIDESAWSADEIESANKAEEQAALRVLDAWRREERLDAKIVNFSRARIDLVVARLAEYAEEALYDAVKGARFDRDFFSDPSRRVPELLFRDGRNVEQCLRALPRRERVPAGRPPPMAVAYTPARDELEDERQRQLNLDGAGKALAALR